MDFLSNLFGCGKAPPPTTTTTTQTVSLDALCKTIMGHKGTDIGELNRLSQELSTAWVALNGKISRSLLPPIDKAADHLIDLYRTGPVPEPLSKVSRSVKATIKTTTQKPPVHPQIKKVLSPPPPREPPRTSNLQAVLTLLQSDNAASAIDQFGQMLMSISLADPVNLMRVCRAIIEKNPTVGPEQMDTLKFIFLYAMKGVLRDVRLLKLNIQENGGCISEEAQLRYSAYCSYEDFALRTFGDPLPLDLLDCLKHVNLDLTRSPLEEKPIEGINRAQGSMYASWLRNTEFALKALSEPINAIEGDQKGEPTTDVTPRTSALRVQLAHISSQFNDLAQSQNTLPGCKENQGAHLQHLQSTIQTMENRLTTLESHHIMTLPTKTIVSKFSQFTLPARSALGNFWTQQTDSPGDGGPAAGFACGFISAYTIYRELTEPLIDELETSLYLGLARAQAIGSNQLALIDTVAIAFDGILTRDEEADSYIHLEAGQEISQYRDLLATLQIRKPIGAIIRKEAAYYTIVAKEDKIIISDSHGFSEHLNDPKPLIGKAFRCEFNDPISAAKFLYLRNPYTESTTSGSTDRKNQCEIYLFQVNPSPNQENLAADRISLEANVAAFISFLTTQATETLFPRNCYQCIIDVASFRKRMAPGQADRLLRAYLAKLGAYSINIDPQARNPSPDEMWEAYAENAKIALERLISMV